MKRALVLTIVLSAALLALPRATRAGTVTFVPNPPDIFDLDHQKYYLWGPTIDGALDGQTVTGAVLRFENIRNWTTEPNDLYVHLLDEAPEGLTVWTDYEVGGDSLTDMGGIELVTYSDLPATAQDLVYEFTEAEIITLNEYLGNGGDFGLGFDPDCHYYNDGVSLELSYTQPSYQEDPLAVPEPLTMLGVALGVGSLATYVRKRKGKVVPRD